MRKNLLLIILVVIILVLILVLIFKIFNNNDNASVGVSDSNNSSTINNKSLTNSKTDYLISDKGKKIVFYIADGFEETDFVSKSDKWKGYHKGLASVDLQIVTKERADSVRKALANQGFKEENYIVNGKTYNKIYSYVDGQEGATSYLCEINSETYYYVSDFKKMLTEKEMNTFLTFNE